MLKQTLNGAWKYRIGKGKESDVTVPFSALPVGHFECRKNFDLEVLGRKVILKFDGITYYAKVFVNYNYVGDMGPYCEYSFDISELVKSTNNEILVELEDIDLEFGPTAGWENFGGIIRNVNIFYYEENYIKDVFFYTKLINGYKDAEITVETTLPNNIGEVQIKLFYKGDVVCCVNNASRKHICTLNGVELWSPDHPELYELQVLLINNNKTIDTYSCKVGFREFSCDNHRFYLNGQPIFLKGVCKHEMFGDSGHCPTYSQMLSDMQMIKNTGSNFVRLVHYPHNKKILEIADEIGLMVSEEPGLWWSDTSKESVRNGSLEVLKRTILRDRNHPSIVFWLSFNECRFTAEYLIESAKVCRKYDHSRLVSGANCMDNEDTLKYFNLCGFDFYTMHPYSQTVDRAVESAKILNDKPLLFTEWGGHFVYDNPKLLTEFLETMYSLYKNPSNEGALAGALFWEWSELNDFNRGRPACVDGNLSEGLVDKYRNPTLIYNAFCNFWANADISLKDEFWIEHSNGDTKDTFISFAGDEEVFKSIINQININERNGTSTRKRKLSNGPILQTQSNKQIIPVCICDNDVFCFDCNITSNHIRLFGLTSIQKGYPLGGEYGETVAFVEIIFEDDTTQVHELKNGIDVTTVFCLKESSRINPIAEKSIRFADFGYDKNFEYYIINAQNIDFGVEKRVSKIKISSSNKNYCLLTYGFDY